MKKKFLTLGVLLTSSSLLLTPCDAFAADISFNDIINAECKEQAMNEETF